MEYELVLTVDEGLTVTRRKLAKMGYRLMRRRENANEYWVMQPMTLEQIWHGLIGGITVEEIENLLKEEGQ